MYERRAFTSVDEKCDVAGPDARSTMRERETLWISARTGKFQLQHLVIRVAAGRAPKTDSSGFPLATGARKLDVRECVKSKEGECNSHSKHRQTIRTA